MFTQHFTSRFSLLFRPNEQAHQATLRLETLEDRTTPAVAANDLFVSSLYQGLLGRNADANGLTYWNGQLNAGVSRTQVAQGIATSNEALNHDVELFYDVFLNRPTDSTGLSYWTNQLKAGETLDQVKAGILGSDEFFRLAGNTNQDFLDALYVHELGRPLDATGNNYWETQLNAGVSRTTVADEVLATLEATHEKITSFYSDVLDRTPDAVGLSYWSGHLLATVPETTVLAGILGSSEYFNRVQSAAAKTPWSDPNQAASDLIGYAGLFTGPLPNAEYLAHRLPGVTLPTPAIVNTPVVTPIKSNPAPAPAVPSTPPAPAVPSTPPAPAVTSNGGDNSTANTSAPSVDPNEYNALAEAASNGVPPPASVATDPVWIDSGAYTTLTEIYTNSQQPTWYASDPYNPANINNIDPSA